MSDHELELFVHAQGAKPKAVMVTPGESLLDVLKRAGVIGEGETDLLVFVGENEQALNEPDEVEDGADQHAPVDAILTVAVLGLKRHGHVHVHRCRDVAVDVNFSGKTKRHRFSPATTIAVVATWARKKLHLDPVAGGEYVLKICNNDKQPRADQHLGELVEASTCSICFDLVKEITPQG
jgi:hypothetical protein